MTDRLAQRLEVDVSSMRIDSIYVLCPMTGFGRAKPTAMPVKRFLIQMRWHDPELYAALPEERRRPLQADRVATALWSQGRRNAKAFAAACAEHLLWIIERIAKCTAGRGRSSYKALERFLIRSAN
jgi:hypothetical protein